MITTPEDSSSTRPYSVTAFLAVLNAHRADTYSLTQGLNTVTLHTSSLEFALQSREDEILDQIGDPLDLNSVMGFDIASGTTSYSVLRGGQHQLISSTLPKGTKQTIVFTEGNYGLELVSTTLDFLVVFIAEINKLSTKSTYAVNYDEVNRRPIIRATNKIAGEKPVPFSFNLNESTVSNNALGQEYSNAHHINSTAVTINTGTGTVDLEYIACSKVPYIEDTSVIFMRFTPVGFEHVFRGSTISASNSLSVNGSFPIVVDGAFGTYLSPKFNQDIYTEIREPLSFSEVRLQLVTDQGEIWQNSSEYTIILRITPNEMICRTRISQEQRMLENVQLAQEIGKYVNGDDPPSEEEVAHSARAEEYRVLKQIPQRNNATILGRLLEEQGKKEKPLGFFSSMFKY